MSMQDYVMGNCPKLHAKCIELEDSGILKVDDDVCVAAFKIAKYINYPLKGSDDKVTSLDKMELFLNESKKA